MEKIESGVELSLDELSECEMKLEEAKKETVAQKRSLEDEVEKFNMAVAITAGKILETTEEIKDDIQTAKDIADDIKALSWKLGFSGKVTDQVVSRVFGSPHHSNSYRSIATWLYYGSGACFLQDADTW